MTSCRIQNQNEMKPNKKFEKYNSCKNLKYKSKDENIIKRNGLRK